MLDFSIYSDTDRTQFISTSLDSREKEPTNKELEAMANYILFGKDQNGKNAVDRGDVEIETKHNTYKKKRTDSLNEALENPLFDERSIKPLKRSVYTNPKPKIDKSLPELQLLLAEIEKYASLYDEAASNPETDKTKLYKLKHYLIELRTQQYTIQEAVRGTVNFPKPSFFSPIYNNDITTDVLPLGVKIGDTPRFIDPINDTSDYTIPTTKRTLNFENPLHIHTLLDNYSILVEEKALNPTSSMAFILDTLDFYIEQTSFDKIRATILAAKKQKLSNSQIKTLLIKKYDTSYNENYLSTIYTKEICRKIAESASLHREYWENRGQLDKFKKCSCCGQYRLLDSREFVRKGSSPDGFTSRCKRCDKEKREEKLKDKSC